MNEQDIEHIHNYNDTCKIIYTCPLQRLQECECGATRYVEIPDSGIPVVKLSTDESKQYFIKNNIDMKAYVTESIARQPIDSNENNSKCKSVDKNKD